MPKTLRVAIVAGVALLLLLGGQGTAALWRTERALPVDSISTGRLELLAGGNGTASAQYPFTELDAVNLLPGSFTQAPLTLSNRGTVDLRYELSGVHSAGTAPSPADTALWAAVTLSVVAVAGPADCAPGQSPAGAPLYSGPVAGARFPAPRPLAASADAAPDTLCVRLSLPANTPQLASGGTVLPVLSFTGAQA